MGRWSTLRIQIKGTVLSVITVYRVCKTPVTLESNTAYSQQWREWKTKTDKKVDPRERTLQDLKKYVKEEIEKKREVVVLIDANESIDSRTEEMNQFIHECGLVDTHLIKDPYDEVETYARGKEKIDFVLVTPRVQQCITYSHIAPYNETIISDHRAFIVDIDYKLMEALRTNILAETRKKYPVHVPGKQKKVCRRLPREGRETKVARKNRKAPNDGH